VTIAAAQDVDTRKYRVPKGVTNRGSRLGGSRDRSNGSRGSGGSREGAVAAARKGTT